MGGFLTGLGARRGLEDVRLVVTARSPLLTSSVPRRFIYRVRHPSKGGQAPAFTTPLRLVLGTSFVTGSVKTFTARGVGRAVRGVGSKGPSPSSACVVGSVSSPMVGERVGECARRTRRG